MTNWGGGETVKTQERQVVRNSLGIIQDDYEWLLMIRIGWLFEGVQRSLSFPFLVPGWLMCG